MQKMSGRYKILQRVAPAIFAVALISAAGCGRKSGSADSDSVDSTAADSIKPIFHADNDIAMVVGSLADAIYVGEPLDSASYSYTGLLTDGTGAPLYFDTHGNPGRWDVQIYSPTTAVIHNVDEGDLVASDVRSYLLTCLNIHTEPVAAGQAGGSEYEIFPLRSGYISFSAPRSDGMQGCEVIVTVADRGVTP